MKNKISVSQQDKLTAKFTAAALTGLITKCTVDVDEAVGETLAIAASQIGVMTTQKYLFANGIEVVPNPES
jgi:hypothetical protein